MNESGRVEAFSDGVFAIAITLLVLEIKVPEHQGDGLWRALGDQWPSYAGYGVSFLVIGIMWANHHAAFSHIVRVDRTLIFLNLLLLMVTAAIPWPTSLVAEYLREGDAAETAVAVYSGFMVLQALLFTVFWWYVTHRGHLLRADVDRSAARRTRVRFGLGSAAYPLLLALSFVAPLVTLLLHGVLAVYYAFNQVRIPEAQEEPAVAG
ncbi:hypothetical protein ACZ90_25930 [Streptomyces albus subsp. albus]|nr:hypothetical protein ACZ90_25930 [Streptomyces albus subsp. albus]